MADPITDKTVQEWSLRARPNLVDTIVNLLNALEDGVALFDHKVSGKLPKGTPADDDFVEGSPDMTKKEIQALITGAKATIAVWDTPQRQQTLHAMRSMR